MGDIATPTEYKKKCTLLISPEPFLDSGKSLLWNTFISLLVHDILIAYHHYKRTSSNNTPKIGLLRYGPPPKPSSHEQHISDRIHCRSTNISQHDKLPSSRNAGNAALTLYAPVWRIRHVLPKFRF